MSAKCSCDNCEHALALCQKNVGYHDWNFSGLICHRENVTSILSIGSSYHGLSSTSPYAYSPLAATASLHNTYSPHQHSAASLGMGGTSHLANGLSPYESSLQSATTSSLTGLYGVSTTSRSSVMTLGMPTIPVPQWPSTPLLPSTPVSFPSLQSRSSSNAAPLHSPLTAQVYSADTASHLRSHSHSASQSIEVGDATYTLQQHSPEQMLPECASTEPSVNTSKPLLY